MEGDQDISSSDYLVWKGIKTFPPLITLYGRGSRHFLSDYLVWKGIKTLTPLITLYGRGSRQVLAIKTFKEVDTLEDIKKLDIWIQDSGDNFVDGFLMIQDYGYDID